MSAADLRVMETAGAVFQGFAQNLKYLPRLALLPFSCSLGIAVLQSMVMSEAVTLILEVADSLVVALFALLWHRLLLFGPRPETLTPLPSFGEKERRFFIYSLIIVLPALVLDQGAQQMLPAAEMGQQQMMQPADIMPLMIAVGAYLFFLLSSCFALPGTAAGLDYSIARSFQETRGARLKMLMIAVVCLLPVQFAAVFITLPVVTITTSTGLIAPLLIVSTLVAYIILPLSTGIITQSFKTVTGWTGPSHPTT